MSRDASRAEIIIALGLVLVLGCFTLSKVSILAEPSANSSNQTSLIPIPYAQLSESSEYPPSLISHPLPDPAAEAKTWLPFNVYVSEDISSDKNGRISTPAMFGRSWIGFGNGAIVNGFIGNHTVIQLLDGK